MKEMDVKLLSITLGVCGIYTVYAGIKRAFHYWNANMTLKSEILEFIAENPNQSRHVKPTHLPSQHYFIGAGIMMMIPVWGYYYNKKGYHRTSELAGRIIKRGLKSEVRSLVVSLAMADRISVGAYPSPEEFSEFTNDT
jgi:hypothetical protein